MSNRSWTLQDIALLRKLAGTMPVGEIAAQLGRSAFGVKVKAHERRIFIRVKQPPRVKRPPEVKYRRWTTEEDDELDRLLQAAEPIETIAGQLNRTPGAVKTRAYYLGFIVVTPEQRLRNKRPLGRGQSRHTDKD